MHKGEEKFICRNIITQIFVFETLTFALFSENSLILTLSTKFTPIKYNRKKFKTKMYFSYTSAFTLLLVGRLYLSSFIYFKMNIAVTAIISF